MFMHIYLLTYSYTCTPNKIIYTCIFHITILCIDVYMCDCVCMYVCVNIYIYIYLYIYIRRHSCKRIFPTYIIFFYFCLFSFTFDFFHPSEVVRKGKYCFYLPAMLAQVFLRKGSLAFGNFSIFGT